MQLEVDRSLIRASARSRRFLRVSLRAPEAASRQGRLPVHLAFVIDRSGSMYGEKLERARQAVVHGIRSLTEGDRFAVVAYDDHVKVVVSSRQAAPAEREAAVGLVEAIDAGRNTNLHAGWVEGCQQVETALGGAAVGRCLLLTDGLANQGVVDHDEIVRQAAGWRDRRVATTTFGVGADFDETLLRRMADAGGGSFRFIASAVQIPDFVASEVGEALATTVREAVLVVDAGEGSKVESLNGFPCRHEDGRWRVPIGSLYSGQLLSPVLRVSLPEGVEGESRHVAVRVEDLDRALAGETASAELRWASDAENDAQQRDVAIARQVATLVAARAERDALECNRRGDYAGARQRLRACVVDLDAYARRDPEILAIARRLEELVGAYGDAMDSIASKTLHSLSSQTLSGRVPRPLRSVALGSSGYLVVPSEWDVQAAIQQVLENALAATPGLVLPDVAGLAKALVHLDVRRCLFDPSQTPTGGVELRLEAAGVCAACRTQLASAGVSGEAMRRLLEALHMLRTPSGVVH
jgi:Ca-activated chloride channel family protein